MPELSNRPAPFSLRLSPDERARLEFEAAGMSLASYIRWRLFDSGSSPPRRRGKVPVKDQRALSILLGKLGQSRVADNLNQLAIAVGSGSLVLTPDIEAEFREAVADIASMRRLLVAALGLSEGASPAAGP